ncbi:MAG: SufD family Fe-S cluster assembly protein, partial [Candidatus Omnitrophica bacterium]|nr:SufD family Fe-S cluster assembly protein [Candidatus Omnitrophota bacterium]
QHVDNHSTMDHRLPNCTSNQLYKGLLQGESHSVFNGKIFVRQIAQKTNSYQLNKNLILGVNCRVDTKPQLEIFADDVKCTHGATIGQLNEEEIFYLQTRCISKNDAIKLLAHGFVQDTLEKITNPAIIEKLNILLEPTFAALEK